ncbi:MAG TPA: Spy/CpxP family protein refolding chaperone [Thermodesulfobacteriota bacterium]|nr:Spy/CpxP family protein refolding chaperone [Thermodesulfobacteriota bacterium]
MKGKIKIWMVGLALVALAGVALAQGPGYGFKGQGNCMGGFDRLNLTADQKTKLTQMQEKNFKEIIPLRNEMQTKRLELQTLWSVPNPDKSKILAKQNELNALRDKMQAKTTEFRLEARSILTPEQAAQVGSFGPGMGMGMGGGRGFGPGRGMGGGKMGQGPCGGGFQGGGYGPCAGGFGPGPRM